MKSLSKNSIMFPWLFAMEGHSRPKNKLSDNIPELCTNFEDWNLISWSNVNKPVCDCNIISPPFCALSQTLFRQKIPASHESGKSDHCRQKLSSTQSVYVTKDLFNMKFYYWQCTEHIALCSTLHQGHSPRCAVNPNTITNFFYLFLGLIQLFEPIVLVLLCGF